MREWREDRRAYLRRVARAFQRSFGDTGGAPPDERSGAIPPGGRRRAPRHGPDPAKSKIARRSVDPCDAKAVRKLLEETLREGSWERLAPPAAADVARPAPR